MEPEAPSPLASLTARERETLKHLGEAMSNKEIAQVMDLSPETIKSYLKRIYIKLGVGSRMEAIRLFYGQTPRR